MEFHQLSRAVVLGNTLSQMHDRRPVLESLPSVCCWGCLECDSQSKSTDIRLIFEFFPRCSICYEKPKKKIREWILVYKLLDHCKFSQYKPYTAFPARRGRQCGNCIHPLLSFPCWLKRHCLTLAMNFPLCMILFFSGEVVKYRAS